jgi:hypothetical protein
MAGASSAVAEAGAGWRKFAGIVLGIGGVMRLVDSYWSFRYSGALPDNLEGALFGRSLSTYGWLYLVVGVLVILAAFGVVLQRSQAARWFGVVAGGVIAVTSALWLPFYPVWSLIYIALGIAVVYALVVYGGSET